MKKQNWRNFFSYSLLKIKKKINKTTQKKWQVFSGYNFGWATFFIT
jgi:hypothetical protein